jgi:copper resistance protein C
MKCPWVTNPEWTTFGRRVVIVSAVFGLTTIGGAATGLAASGPIGTSPAAGVVSKAPMAVSVTFGEPLRAEGARLTVLTAEGDVGTGDVTTADRTLRRELRAGAPGGTYTVEWKAVSAKGRRMSGSFSFVAARGNGESASTAPEAVRRPSAAVTTAPTAATTPTAPTTPAAPATPPAPTTPTAPATPTILAAPAVPSPTGTVWPAPADPIWTAPPTRPGAALPPSGSRSSDVRSGLTAVPLAVGGLLVLAAGLVPLVNRRGSALR